MSALRAMLQLRPHSQPDSCSSDVNSINATHNNNSVYSPQYQSTSGQASSVHSISTASFQHSMHNQQSASASTSSTIAASTTPKPSTPTKKSPPFQNLGLHSGAAMGNL
ncbi:hypothetical protein BGZ46_003989, partial [Entomortierella lignicola]